MINIKRIEPKDAVVVLDDINHLLPQLSPSGKATPIALEELKECLDNKNFCLFAAESTVEDGARSVVGLGSIFFQRNLGGWIAEIHDIVVGRNERGKGLGEKIVTRLIEEAINFVNLRQRPVKLYLTSRPRRVTANKLYLKLGFELVAEAAGERGTNLYKMVLKPGE